MGGGSDGIRVRWRRSKTMRRKCEDWKEVADYSGLQKSSGDVSIPLLSVGQSIR